MRNPLNRNTFRFYLPDSDSQPMLMRRRRFRYDDAVLEEPSWPDHDADRDFDAEEPDMDVTGAGAVGGTSPIRPTQLSPVGGCQRGADRRLRSPGG